MHILNAFECQKTMKSKIQKSLIQGNNKNILFIVMTVNWYVSIISLVSSLKHT